MSDEWVSPLGHPCPANVRAWIEARKARKTSLGIPKDHKDESIDACNWSRQGYLDMLDRNGEGWSEDTLDAFDAGFWRGISWMEWQSKQQQG